VKERRKGVEEGRGRGGKGRGPTLMGTGGERRRKGREFLPSPRSQGEQNKHWLRNIGIKRHLAPAPIFPN